MDDISNRTLALLLVTSIIVSLGFTLYSLNGMTRDPVTGRVGSTGSGRVNLTVASSVSITLNQAGVDFGYGYVNSSLSCPNNATLNAGQSYNDTESTTINKCWTQTQGSAVPTSLRIENDGNVNVLLTVMGPDQRNFLNYSGSNPNNLTWRARNNEAGACVTGAATFQQTYTDFAGISKTVCSNLTYQPSSNDEIAIDIQLIIPVDIKPGEYLNSSIVFTAAQQN